LHYKAIKTKLFHPYNGRRAWGVKLFADDGTKSIVRYTTVEEEAIRLAGEWNKREGGHKYG